MNIYQALSDAGLNPFAITLLCESLLRAPMAKEIVERGKPIEFDFPINRADCAGYRGVHITLMPLREKADANPR